MRGAASVRVFRMKFMNMSELHDACSSPAPNTLVVDVRTPGEFSEGRVPGARNIPVDVIMKHHEELRPFASVYLYCRAGARAQMAGQMLEIQGLKNLVCVDEGGFPDWEDAGFPVER
jgi:rhodanese-related sulfurtransferase